MLNLKSLNSTKKPSAKIAVIGSGVIGCTTALHLAKSGHNVFLIDETLSQKINFSQALNGSKASLGILMGYIYRKSSGRSWKLRKRSMELWPNLIDEIKLSKNSLDLKRPLIQLAASEEEMKILEKLVSKKNIYGLELIDQELKKYFSNIMNMNIYGGIISTKDGRIDPLILLKHLLLALNNYQVNILINRVDNIKRKYSNGKTYWEIILCDKNLIGVDIIIMCAALGSQELLKNLGHTIELEPILGQAIEMNNITQIQLDSLPAVLNIQGINLIPTKNNTLLIGSTLEKGTIPNISSLNEMLMQSKNNFLKNADIVKTWYGIRAKPIGQPAPILEKLEAGLIINTGHYRNGILLAPACAEWVSKQIDDY
tara:strand:- start:1463 stop:2572 length:1110 start_codon:yes stop_codon:yes gene_type:complete